MSSSGPKAAKTSCALVLAQLVERELVVVAHEVGPLAVLGDRRQRASAARSGAASSRASARNIAWFTMKSRTHVQLVAVLVAEELALLARRRG